jgi:hypothetical protein
MPAAFAVPRARVRRLIDSPPAAAAHRDFSAEDDEERAPAGSGSTCAGHTTSKRDAYETTITTATLDHVNPTSLPALELAAV